VSEGGKKDIQRGWNLTEEERRYGITNIGSGGGGEVGRGGSRLYREMLLLNPFSRGGKGDHFGGEMRKRGNRTS